MVRESFVVVSLCDDQVSGEKYYRFNVREWGIQFLSPRPML